MQRKFIFTSLVILLLPAATMINFLVTPAPTLSEEWKRYVPVLITEETASFADYGEESLEGFFRRQGWEDIITRASQQVQIFTYGDGEKSIAYGEVETYFDPLDPRYNPYLKGLDSYFSGSIDGKPARIVYLGHDGDAAAAMKRTVQELEERQMDFFVPLLESGGTAYYRLLLLPLIGVFLVLVPRRGKLLFALGAAGPALAAAASPTLQFPLFALVATQATGWSFSAAWAGATFTRHFNIGYPHLKRDFKFRLAIYGVFAIAGLIIALSSGLYQSPISPVVLSLNTAVLHAALVYLYFLITQRKVRRQQHTLFFPVPMRQNERAAFRFVPQWALILLIVAALPLGVNVMTPDQSAREAVYPQPLPLENSGGLDWESLRRFYEERQQSVQPAKPEKAETAEMPGMPEKAETAERAERATTTENPGEYLPDIADYVSHRAHQEGFLYGREYRFPEKGERIVLKVYEKQGLKIFGKDRVFKMFTEEWYEDIMSDASNNGVSRLLCAQDEPVQIAYRKNNTFRIPTHTLLGYFIVFLMLYPVVYSIVSKNMNRQSFSFEKHQHKKGQKVA